jgi:anaerobic ribonucleoside-triphosphate reductase
MVQQSNSTRTMKCHICGFDGDSLETKRCNVCNKYRVQTLFRGGGI